MTFLELVQSLWQESGASGTSGPVTVVAQTGEYGRMVAWINSAWRDIQLAHRDWEFMRASASFTTVAQQATYALGSGAGTVGVTAATFGMWARGTGRVYKTAVGTGSELFLVDTDYDAWRNAYQFGNTRISYSQPNVVAISPAKGLCLGPVPLAGYTVTHDYFTAPVALAVDADTPTLPAQYHMAIVQKALMYYGAYEAAVDVKQNAEMEFSKFMMRLNADRLPEMTFGGPLA